MAIVAFKTLFVYLMLMNQLEQFIKTGFIKVENAFSRELAEECVQDINKELKSHAIDLFDRSTWKKPVVRINTLWTESFVKAGTSSKLWDAYNEIIGPGIWEKKQGVGGTLPIRFPIDNNPGDAGWHIDGSFEVEGEYWVNYRSRERALLCLFLFTDISKEDAPTEIISGSHLDIPEVLKKYGEKGLPFYDVVGNLYQDTFDVSKKERAFAIGNAGDVYICHPFLVHRATWPNRGKFPRIIAQPEVPFSKNKDIFDANYFNYLT